MIYNKFLYYVAILSFVIGQTYPEIGSDNSLDIITWNIENFPKDSETINYVSDIINDISVDIIALQEIENQQAFNSLINQLSDDWSGYRASDGDWGELSYLINRDNVNITYFPYTILNQYEYYFAYRPPYVVHVTFNDEEYILINVHLKCCGDGYIEDDDWDEEFRRLKSNEYLKEYIDNNFSTDNVIVLGDFNDDIAEASNNNVFMNFLNDSENYYFSDMHIAEGSNSNWSFPNWPSHLDHILITNELFDNFNIDHVFTFRVDDYMNNWNEYDNYISDHRPVAINILLPIIGDINLDGEVNILDITLLINMILQDNYADDSDFNNDGGLNILDVIILMNIILE